MTAPTSPTPIAPADADLAMSTARAASKQTKLRQTTDPAAAEKTARDFESVFLAEMLRPIFATVKPDGEFGGGHGEEVFKSLLVDEYAKKIAHSTHSIGIAEAVKKVILKTQDSEQPRPTASPRAARAYQDPTGAVATELPPAPSVEGVALPPAPAAAPVAAVVAQDAEREKTQAERPAS